ncbi:MAG: tetratricopeptide repeat protein, partial [Chloroflexi bacterium]|nr:tetratricopeptide repeat protein [Chloroflexota bacterium]
MCTRDELLRGTIKKLSKEWKWAKFDRIPCYNGAMLRLHLSLLGAFQAKLNDEPISRFEYDKVRVLLAYLAVESDRPHRRDALTGLFWPEQTDKRARHSLSQALLKLRQVLGDANNQTPFILADRSAIQLNPDADVSLDADEFEEALAFCATHKHPYAETCSDCMTQRRTAVSLYRGDFLEGFSLGDSPAFDDWLALNRERLHRLTIDALFDLTQYHEWRGELNEAREYGQRQAALEPWREEAHRQLMRLLAHSGRRSAAVAQYERCRQILAEELGIEPAPETTRLVERIRAAENGRSPQLPAQSTPFIGRKREVAELNGMLSHPDNHLIMIVGPGGMGKTRLALQVAARKADSFLDGVCFAPLTAVETVDFLVTAVAQALEFRFADKTDPEPQLVDYLRDKEMLLILDNFEQALAGAKLVADILACAPGIKILVTSRVRLNLSWETIFELDGLAWPDREQAADGERFSAARLFIASAQRSHRSFAFMPAEAPHIQRICQLVGGMPLAIELAASWIRVMSCREIASEIERGIDFLATAVGDRSPRHRSIRAVFDHSWQLLSSSERKLFRSLSVFRGGFIREAAAQITGAAPRDLAALVDKSLLRRDTDGRFSSHGLLQQYGAEKLAQRPAEARRAYIEHSRYFALFLNRQTERLQDANQKQALAVVNREIDNVQAAWDWLAQQQDGHYLNLCLEALGLFYDRQGWLAAGRRAFETAVARMTAAAQTEDTTLLLARLSIRLARFESEQADFESARERLIETIPILRNRAESNDLALTLRYLGNVEGSLGAYETAVNAFQESLNIYKSSTNKIGEAAALKRLTTMYGNLGRLETARKNYQEGLTISREIQDLSGEGASRHGLGHIAYDLGDYVEAATCFQRSLEIAQDSGTPWEIARTVNLLGNVHYAQGDYPAAEHCYRQSMQIRRELGARSGIASAANNLGIVAFARGELAATGKHYRHSLSIAREIGNKRAVAITLNNLGELASATADYQQSLTYHLESLQDFQAIGQMRGQMYALNFLGGVSLALGLDE